MKKLFLFVSLFFVLSSCENKYLFNDHFLMPNIFLCPERVKIDLFSFEPVVFTWSGGGAEDGGILLYDVLFDRADGDFSAPLYTVPSDLGALSQVTLSHIELDQIAKSAGLKATQSHTFKWTVQASRGGYMKMATETGSILLIRPDQEIPEEFYLLGPGSEKGDSASIPFRKITAGVFVLYTKVTEGEGLLFTDGQNDAETYAMDQSGALINSEEFFTLATSFPIRITVNFNTMQVTVEEISSIQMIWGINFDIIAELKYVGGGIFKAENVTVNFLLPGDPEWLTWTEDRYYFITTIDNEEVCWGRMDSITDQAPDPTLGLKFYEIGEFVWDQWYHLWKFDPTINGKTCTVYINTNLEDMMVHQFTDIR